MSNVRIGIVGAGGMAKVHRANIEVIDGAETVAVVGTSERTKQTAADWGVPCFDTIKEMVEAVDVDIVDICTPTSSHHDLVMQSLTCGKDTIVEKPIALSYSDAREMLDTAKEKGLHLYVAQVLQFTKEVQTLHKIVESGELGEPLDAVFERLSACPKWAADGWLFDKEKSGLLYYDLHIHDLDVIISVFGSPNAYSYTSCRGEDKNYPEQIRIDYDYGKLHVIGEAAWFNADIPWTARWRVYFENGMLINDEHGLISYQFGREPIVYDISDEVTISTGINVPPTGWYYNELKHFVECWREGIDSPYVPAEQLLTVMKLLEEMAGE